MAREDSEYITKDCEYQTHRRCWAPFSEKFLLATVELGVCEVHGCYLTLPKSASLWMKAPPDPSWDHHPQPFTGQEVYVSGCPLKQEDVDQA